MKLKVAIIILFLGLNSIAQTKFEKGYYIDNSNKKVECFIKNIDWLNNPIKVTYKLKINSKQKDFSIKNVKEFGIYNASKYIRASVDIDRSSKFLKELTRFKEPNLKEEELFLKVLVEGMANLYSYTDGDGNLVRFFFNKNDSKIKQLIFKKYRKTDNRIARNNKYKQQLWSSLKCNQISFNSFKNLDYNEKDLIHFFKNFYNCKKLEFSTYEKKGKKDLFNLNFRIGVNNSSLSTGNTLVNSNSIYPNFKNQFGLRLGIELEFIMPFNNNKWSFIIEPNYQSFNAEITSPVMSSVEYTSFELPVGIRHYLFLNKNSKLFANGSLIVDFGSGKLLNQTIKSKTNFGFGIGYKTNNKYSIELRYHTNRDLFSGYTYSYSAYKTTSLIFGYTLF